MTSQQQHPNGLRPPFYITRKEEQALRVRAEELEPSLVIAQPSSFDEYVRQFMVPPAVMDLARKAANIRLAAWEIQAIRWHLEPREPGERPGLLRWILEEKAKADPSHPPYIRVACTGVGDYDEEAKEYGFVEDPVLYDTHRGDFGSPVVLELWPAQHYSPIHSHGNTTGIIYCLAGQLDVMSYQKLAWDSGKRGLVTLTPGQCAWLAGDEYAVHKVYCPMDGGDPDPEAPKVAHTGLPLLNNTGDFGASFHVYLNQGELTAQAYSGAIMSREEFDYIDESAPHKKKKFKTYSDISWRALRMVLAKTALEQEIQLPVITRM